MCGRGKERPAAYLGIIWDGRGPSYGFYRRHFEKHPHVFRGCGTGHEVFSTWVLQEARSAVDGGDGDLEAGSVFRLRLN